MARSLGHECVANKGVSCVRLNHASSLNRKGVMPIKTRIVDGPPYKTFVVGSAVFMDENKHVPFTFRLEGGGPYRVFSSNQEEGLFRQDIRVTTVGRFESDAELERWSGIYHFFAHFTFCPDKWIVVGYYYPTERTGEAMLFTPKEFFAGLLSPITMAICGGNSGRLAQSLF